MTQRGRTTALVVMLLGVLMLAALVLMASATRNATRFDHLFSFLLIGQGLGLVLFSLMIGLNLRGLLRKLRRGDPGSRLTLRMLGMFVTLAILPAIIIYSFSLDFLRRGVDSWFDVETEAALTDALELSKYALDIRMREHLTQLGLAATEISTGGGPSVPLDLSLLRAPDATVISNSWDFGAPELDSLRNRLGAEELVMLSREGRILGASSSLNDFVPSEPPGPLMLQLRQGRNYIALEPQPARGLVIQAGVPVKDPQMAGRDRVLYAIFPVSQRPNELASNIQAAFAKYERLVYLRQKLKLSFTLILTLVLFFSITSAVLVSFYASRRLAAPIHKLAAGTRAVASGDYSVRVPKDTRDDFGVLVASFNDMTSQLQTAQAQARASRDALEQQHAYLAAVLGNLSSGVMTISREGELRTCNPACEQILGIDLASFIGRPLAEVEQLHAFLEPFVQTITNAAHEMMPEWNKEIVFFGRNGRQHVMCRGVALAATDAARDFVVVFDDLTGLVQGERDAAWSEVARRLAHEVKNPLTPIQLSAERLRHKYLQRLDTEDQEAFLRLTSTIVQQVDAMKRMVNTFSDYARPPKPEFDAVDLNELIRNMFALYRGIQPEPELKLDLADTLPTLHADASRLRQVLNNLIKNAIEAHPEGEHVHIEVTTRERVDDHLHYVELEILDAGSGLEHDSASDIFAPYVTHKEKGTGLGLAIVKKIIEEHGGDIWIKNRIDRRGARVLLRLPLRADEALSGPKPKQGAVTT